MILHERLNVVSNQSTSTHHITPQVLSTAASLRFSWSLTTEWNF